MDIVIILVVTAIFIWLLVREETWTMIKCIVSFFFGCFITAALMDYSDRHEHKDYIYINRYDLGIKTVVKDSLEDTVFITNKYMTKDEFIKRFIEKD